MFIFATFMLDAVILFNAEWSEEVKYQAKAPINKSDK